MWKPSKIKGKSELTHEAQEVLKSGAWSIPLAVWRIDHLINRHDEMMSDLNHEWKITVWACLRFPDSHGDMKSAERWTDTGKRNLQDRLVKDTYARGSNSQTLVKRLCFQTTRDNNVSMFSRDWLKTNMTLSLSCSDSITWWTCWLGPVGLKAPSSTAESWSTGDAFCA